MTMYQEYRPMVWNQVVGQEHIIIPLKNAINRNQIPHAFIFNGPRGTGKTTIARIVAKALNCLDQQNNEPCGKCVNCKAIEQGTYLDLMEIDAASNRGIDNIRALKDSVSLSPSQGQYKIYIIDEVHMLTNEAFNALLKTLEEPPANVIFILATTELDKVPETIISRCQVHNFRPLSKEEVIKRIAGVCKREKINTDIEVLELIYKTSKGGMRDAFSLLEQGGLIAGEEKLTTQIVYDMLGKRYNEYIPNIIEKITASEDLEVLNIIQTMSEQGSDFKGVIPEIVDYLEEILHTKYGNNDLKSEKIKELAEKVTIESLLYIIDLFSETYQKLIYNPNARLLLETTCIKACRGGYSLSSINKEIQLVKAGMKVIMANLKKHS